MKTKKVITLLALLLAGVFVSAQSYMESESIRLEKERLSELNQQISVSYLSAAHTAFMSWASFFIAEPASLFPGNSIDKSQVSNSSTSSYVRFYEENGRLMKVVTDGQPMPRRYIPGTPENGFKPVVP